MDWGYVTAVALLFSVLLIATQRMIERHRRFMRGFVIVLAVLLMIRYTLQLENIVAYLIALCVSFIFWLLIGRYNPAPTDDKIKVFGLDD
ncbi:MAG: hypothetical protein KC546_14860 [Anaerolineae bacterium]|nr:hypothetical protein [Anaerolineae bacterium]MCA9889657.1 hypothetical protein [Anaerolineae bacterium]MCA9893226.1 hypothetical protein [Anaerolineae bacterium]MCB9459970.1 hypothetical protein [Anaerolineaceae bacterium]